jgi:hypothetical protein
MPKTGMLSDLSTEEVVNRQQAGDQLLRVKFFKKKIRHNFESEKQGKDVLVDKDYVQIKIPGSIDPDRVFQATEDHKQRFSLQWQAYQQGLSSQGGTPITTMPGLANHHIEACMDLGVETVEQLAAAHDGVMNQLGPDGRIMKELAQDFLDSKPKRGRRKKVDEPIDDNTESSEEDEVI